MSDVMDSQLRIPVVLLLGPTAVGKSGIALELAHRFPIEIVSVDSAQIYRGMDIGTAKPDRATQEAIPHHLIDVVDPTETYSAARFVADAVAAIAAIRARGRMPLLVGGTMLYFKALTEGLSALPGADTAVRAELDRRGRAEGWPTLHAELSAVDPITAARLAPTDAQRIQRALEVYALAGRPLSSLHAARARPDLGPQLSVALWPEDRSQLHAAIARRFDAMLAAGIGDELRALRARYVLTAELPSMRSVGYRQVWRYLEGDGDLALLRERAVAATRQLAKRQLTWMRTLPAHAVPAGDAEGRVACLIEGALRSPEKRTG